MQALAVLTAGTRLLAIGVPAGDAFTGMEVASTAFQAGRDAVAGGRGDAGIALALVAVASSTPLAVVRSRAVLVAGQHAVAVLGAAATRSSTHLGLVAITVGRDTGPVVSSAAPHAGTGARCSTILAGSGDAATVDSGALSAVGARLRLLAIALGGGACRIDECAKPVFVAARRVPAVLLAGNHALQAAQHATSFGLATDGGFAAGHGRHAGVQAQVAGAVLKAAPRALAVVVIRRDTVAAVKTALAAVRAELLAERDRIGHAVVLDARARPMFFALGGRFAVIVAARHARLVVVDARAHARALVRRRAIGVRRRHARPCRRDAQTIRLAEFRSPARGVAGGDAGSGAKRTRAMRLATGQAIFGGGRACTIVEDAVTATAGVSAVLFIRCNALAVDGVAVPKRGTDVLLGASDWLAAAVLDDAAPLAFGDTGAIGREGLTASAAGGAPSPFRTVCRCCAVRVGKGATRSTVQQEARAVAGAPVGCAACGVARSHAATVAGRAVAQLAAHAGGGAVGIGGCDAALAHAGAAARVAAPLALTATLIAPGDAGARFELAVPQFGTRKRLSAVVARGQGALPLDQRTQTLQTALQGAPAVRGAGQLAGVVDPTAQPLVAASERRVAARIFRDRLRVGGRDRGLGGCRAAGGE